MAKEGEYTSSQLLLLLLLRSGATPSRKATIDACDAGRHITAGATTPRAHFREVRRRWSAAGQGAYTARHATRMVAPACPSRRHGEWAIQGLVGERIRMKKC
uniref:Putative secreted protein n=1 Tax=Anopheles triannulatus TaxID=58253 RepID=A0A2M4B5V0_9DIPT